MATSRRHSARQLSMGCGGSKAADDAPAGGSPLLPTGSKGGGFQGTFQDAAAGRRSIVHKAQELEGEVTEDAPFDDAMIGTVTRHGIAPARGAGGSKAKINQDRGVVCWPFNGSHNQALLCVFDGHGMQGERISEFCAMEVPKRLEADRGLLASDATKCLIKNVRAPRDRLPPRDCFCEGWAVPPQPALPSPVLTPPGGPLTAPRPALADFCLGQGAPGLARSRAHGAGSWYHEQRPLLQRRDGVHRVFGRFARYHGQARGR